MSASREKKQRQSAGPDQRSVKVQQEQAARKRTTMIYSVIAAVIAVLVVALLIWRSGFFQSRATAVTLGDDSLTTAEFSFYYYDARQSTAMYAAYGLTDFDTGKADDEQFYDEAESQTYRDYFLEQALENAKTHKALADQALNSGHTEAEVKDAVDSSISDFKTQAAGSGYSYAAYLRAMYGPYMTASVYEKMVTRYELASLAADDQYEKIFNDLSQAELDAYYQENADDLDTFEYSYLYFPVDAVGSTDADGNELSEDEVNKLQDEAVETVRKDAEAALAAVKSGSTFQSQIDKYDLSLGGDHVTVVGSSTIGTGFSDQLLTLSKGDFDLVPSETGFYVINLIDRRLSDEPTRDVRHILARADSDTDDDGKLVPPTDEAWASAKAKMDEIQAAWEGSGKSEDDFANLANEKSDDGDGTTGGLYERNVPGNFVPEFNDWVFDSSRKAGDVGMVQHIADEGSTSGYYGYHLIYYVGENEPSWMGTARTALANTAQEEWMDGLTDNYEASAVDGANYLGR